MAVFFVTTDIDLGAGVSAVKNADRTDLLLAIVIYYLSLVVRTYRWRWMLQLETAENRQSIATAFRISSGSIRFRGQSTASFLRNSETDTGPTA